MSKTIACAKCGVYLRHYWLKDGVCNGCRNPDSIVIAQLPANKENNMSRHTKEPWKYEPTARRKRDSLDKELGINPRGAWIHIGTGEVCQATTGEPACKPNGRDNATRIIECVNACEGLPDPSVVKDLLDACKKALSCMSPDDNDVTAQALRKAIAKAGSTL